MPNTALLDPGQITPISSTAAVPTPAKHVTVKVRFIQECVQRKIVRISYVATRKNISDKMTKQSVGQPFISHRDFTLGYVDSFAGVNTFAGTALFRR